MKRYIITIFLIFSTFIFAKVRIEDIKNKKLIDNIAYFKNESLPFSGKFIGNNIEEEYLEGVREGEWKFYYSSGELKTIINYKDGKRDGESIIYGKGGEILQKLKFLDGIEVGENEEYKNYGDKILDGFKKFTDELEYKKYDDILDEI